MNSIGIKNKDQDGERGDNMIKIKTWSGEITIKTGRWGGQDRDRERGDKE